MHIGPGSGKNAVPEEKLQRRHHGNDAVEHQTSPRQRGCRQWDKGEIQRLTKMVTWPSMIMLEGEEPPRDHVTDGVVPTPHQRMFACAGIVEAQHGMQHHPHPCRKVYCILEPAGANIPGQSLNVQ